MGYIFKSVEIHNAPQKFIELGLHVLYFTVKFECHLKDMILHTLQPFVFVLNHFRDAAIDASLARVK
jgi:hypothetical protein